MVRFSRTPVLMSIVHMTRVAVLSWRARHSVARHGTLFVGGAIVRKQEQRCALLNLIQT